MLAKRYRLPVQSVLRKSGRSIKGRYFLLKVFPNDLAFNRFGVIINKQVSKKSTARNKLKRLIMESAKEFLLKGRDKSDFLIIVFPQIMGLKPEEIKKYVQDIFIRSAS